jgi:hypothetical protein
MRCAVGPSQTVRIPKLEHAPSLHVSRLVSTTQRISRHVLPQLAKSRVLRSTDSRTAGSCIQLQTASRSPIAGVLLDIDGVMCSGKQVRSYCTKYGPSTGKV